MFKSSQLGKIQREEKTKDVHRMLILMNMK
jgi:hypothetical protein